MRNIIRILLVSSSIVSVAFDNDQAHSRGERTCVPKHFAPGRISDTGHEVFRGVFSPDNSRFLFFRSLEGQENYGIFESTLLDTHVWSEPIRLILGIESSDFYPSYSIDGSQLVFSSYRGITPGEPRAENANFWISNLTEEGWSAPTLVQELSKPDQYDNRAHFLDDGTIRFSSTSSDWSETHEYVATMNGNSFSDPTLDSDRERFRDWAKSQPGLHLWTSDLSPDGGLAVLEVSRVNEEGRPGPADLWIAHKTGNGWSTPEPTNVQINTDDGNENFPTFTADGTKMTFVRDFKSFYRVSVSCLFDRD